MKINFKIYILFILCLFILSGCSTVERDKKITQYNQLEGRDLAELISHDVVGIDKYENRDTFIDYKENNSIIELDIMNVPSLTLENNRDKFLLDSSKVIKLYFNNSAFTDSLNINWYVSYRDTYGNLKLNKVFVIRIDRKEYEKINWDHFKINNLTKIASYYWEDEFYMDKGKFDDAEK